MTYNECVRLFEDPCNHTGFIFLYGTFEPQLIKVARAIQQEHIPVEEAIAAIISGTAFHVACGYMEPVQPKMLEKWLTAPDSIINRNRLQERLS